MKKTILRLCLALPGLGICFIFLLFGEYIRHVSHSNIPGVILGMLLFLFFLALYDYFFKRLPLFIKKTSDFFLPLLPLFILPSCIGILANLNLLQDDVVKITIALIVGIILTQIITPYVFIVSLKIFKGKST